MAKVKLSRAKDYREQLRLYITLTKPLYSRLRAFNKRYGKLASEQYNTNQKILPEYYDDYFQDLYFMFKNNIENVFESVNTRFKRTREIKADNEIIPYISEYVTEQTAQNVANITESTRRYIETAVASGIAAGISPRDISYAIQNSTGFSDSRSKLIARTETHQAMNFASYKVANNLLLTEPVKEWGSALDTRTRQWHRDMAGTRIRLNQSFKVFTPVSGGGISERSMEYCGDANGGASNVINCRCFTLYYEKGDVVED
jgi:hypothetical protein